MKNKDYDIIYYINKHYTELIEETKIISFPSDFEKNQLIKKAATLDIIQISECVKKLSGELLNTLNKNDVRGVSDFRNHLVHGYEETNNSIIFNTIRNDLPGFVNQINDEAFKMYINSLKTLIGKSIYVDFNANNNTYYYREIITPHYMYQQIILKNSNDGIQHHCKVIDILIKSDEYYLLCTH